MRLFLIFFLYLFSSCFNESSKVEIPLKPKSVPEKAFWKGGVDGGNWFLIKSIHDHRNNAVISIYNDQDGSLTISKTFMIVCPIDNLKFIKNLQEEIEGFDGEKIILNSPCYLQPLSRP